VLNELCHLWERHHLQPCRHAHRGQQTVCASVRAGRCAQPVRNCVLFLQMLIWPLLNLIWQLLTNSDLAAVELRCQAVFMFSCYLWRNYTPLWGNLYPLLGNLYPLCGNLYPCGDLYTLCGDIYTPYYPLCHQFSLLPVIDCQTCR